MPTVFLAMRDDEDGVKQPWLVAGDVSDLRREAELAELDQGEVSFREIQAVGGVPVAAELAESAGRIRAFAGLLRDVVVPEYGGRRRCLSCGLASFDGSHTEWCCVRRLEEEVARFAKISSGLGK
jgi:hypothetical protein